jgi:hypothetical protein
MQIQRDMKEMELELTGSRAEQQHRAVVSDPVGRRASAALRVFAIAAIGLVLTACGGGGGSSSGDGGSGGVGNVTVTVTDEAGDEVFAASVTATNGGTTKSGTTAPDGTVTLSGLPVGSTSITVSKDLYDTATKSVSVPRDSTAAAAVKINRKKGSIAATVTDQFDTPIQNATITAAVDGKNITGKTAADGKVTLASIPTGTVAVSVVASGFKNPAVQNLAVAENLETPLLSRLERSTQAAGGFVVSRVVGTPTNNGKTIQFSVQLLVVDESSAAIESLGPADFILQDCVVVTTAPNNAPECIRSSSVSNDVGYTVTSVPTAPATFALIPGNPAKPYAAALVLDQSDSIRDSDPTDARIFASKTFLKKVGANDRVVLSAFAADAGEFALAKIPVPPLTIYPLPNSGTEPLFTADGTSYFDELDELAKQEGGETPLYASLDSMVDYTALNAPPGIPGQLKAAVLFSDGDDTDCTKPSATPCLAARDAVIIKALDKGVDLFTIGLSDQVNFEAMAELADRGNGMFLFAEFAEQLIPIYGALGNLLSRSLATYEVTWTIEADAAGAFLPGRTILGTVQVRTASNPVNLPVIVRIAAP